jgi:hypothetical protein
MKTTEPFMATSSLDFLEVLEKASHLINQSEQRELLRDINTLLSLTEIQNIKSPYLASLMLENQLFSTPS